MKLSSSTESQRGSSLVEVFVALLLVSLIGKGAVQLTTKATATFTDLQLLELSVNQLRSSLIMNHDICTNAPVVILPGNISITADVQGCDTTTTATIDGVTVAHIPKPISLSVTSDLLGGQVVVGGTWDPLEYP